MINRYVYPLNHSIARHSDSKAFYDACDPIASFSMRLGSVLLVNIKGSNGLSRKGDAGQVTRAALAIWQPPNSILIMGGNFQDQFEHSLPSWADMRTLSMKEDDSNFFSCEADLFRISWCGSSKKDFQLGMDWMSSLALQRQPLENARWNVTLRWIRKHLTEDCPRASESSFANRRIEDLQGTGQAAGASSSSTPPWALQQDAPRQVSAAASQPLPPQSLPPWALLEKVPEEVSAEASQPGAPGLPEPPAASRLVGASSVDMQARAFFQKSAAPKPVPCCRWSEKRKAPWEPETAADNAMELIKEATAGDEDEKERAVQASHWEATFRFMNVYVSSPVFCL